MAKRIRKNKAKSDLAKDLAFIFIGAVLALLLSRLGFICWLVNAVNNQYIASFIAGAFFTSVFTIAPASVALVSVLGIPATTVALWGALGAMFGDLILFFFIRDHFSEDIIASIKPSITKHILNSFHLGFMRWLSPLLGAIIIASPLPDEFGLTLLGLSKIRVSLLLPIAFAMNFLGIYSLLWFAKVI